MTAGSGGRATFILADISGYTAFLANVGAAHGAQLERGHAPAAYPLMTTLLDSIVQNLAPPFVLEKLEGDAVFAFADDGSLDVRGEALLACLAGCYRSFRDHIERTEQALTCSCDACVSVSGLDLKFALHHGSYVAQSIAGSTELLGPDVTVAHRMLKNEVTEVTSWRAYALLSKAVTDHLDIPATGGRWMVLDYEHIEPLEAYVFPLK